jgi:hypothetical protein
MEKQGFLRVRQKGSHMIDRAEAHGRWQHNHCACADAQGREDWHIAIDHSPVGYFQGNLLCLGAGPEAGIGIGHRSLWLCSSEEPQAVSLRRNVVVQTQLHTHTHTHTGLDYDYFPTRINDYPRSCLDEWSAVA